MKTLIWNSNSDCLEKFLEMAGRYISIDLYEELDDLVSDVLNDSILVFDLDVERKVVEKKLKALRKAKLEFKLVFITENMTPKEIAKHQKSKLGGDAYLKMPVEESVLLSALEPVVGVNLKSQLEEKQRKIISEHQEDKVLDEDTAIISSKLDELFKESLGEAPEVTGHVQLSDFPELSGGKVEEADEALDLGELNENEDSTGTEELSMTDDNNDDGLDLGLDLGLGEESDASVSVEENLDEGEGLEFGVGDEEDDLVLDSSEETYVQDNQEEGLDLSGDLVDVGLDLEQAEDVAVDAASDDHGLDLSLDEDEGGLSLEGNEAAELSLNEEGEEDGLDLSLSNDGDEGESLNFDLGESDDKAEEGGLVLSESHEEEVGELSLGEEEVGELSLGEEEDLGLSLEGSSGSDLSVDELDLSEEGGDSEPELNSNTEEDSLKTDADLFEDGGLDLDDEDLFGQVEDDILSADSLPEVPSLDSDEEDMSPDAINKLAEIEQMMASEGVESSVSELAEQLNAEEEDFDPTMDEELDFGSDEDSTSFFNIGDKLKENSKENPEVNTRPEPKVKEVEKRTISEQKDIIDRNDDEFMRLGETIKQLRHDRQLLMEKVEEMEERFGKEKKDFSNIQAELDEKKIELTLLTKRKNKQLEEMSYRLELSEEKKMILEERNKRLEIENEELRRKTSGDLHKNKSRERELENKLELLKADTDLQIKNRDFKILELKRKIDSLEFDMESIQLKEKKTVDNKYAMEERMERVINTLRRAIGELEEDDMPLRDLQKLKKNLDV